MSAMDDLRLRLDASTLDRHDPSSSASPSSPATPAQVAPRIPSPASPSLHLSAISPPPDHTFAPSQGSWPPPSGSEISALVTPHGPSPSLLISDQTYIAQPVSENPYIQPYPSCLFQTPAGDYANVYLPFAGPVPLEFQLPYASPQIVQFPQTTFPFWPSDSGTLMLDPQYVALLGGAMPSWTVPPAAAVMVDPSHPGVNDGMDQILGFGIQAPFQEAFEGSSALIPAAAAGSFTAAVGFPLTVVPPCDDHAVPVTFAYPFYHDGNFATAAETWDASADYLGSYPGYFYLPANFAQSYGSPTMVHLMPENSAFTKSWVPLQDYAASSSSLEDVPGRQIVNSVESISTASKFVGKEGGGNNSPRDIQDGRPTPVKSIEQASELPAKDMGSRAPAPDEQREYNRPDFKTDHEDAKFFIIKSFSEVNVRRSVIHKVWSSTHHGNRKLDHAYEDAQARAAERPNGCPVFLFFSVNGSGQFCGVAEMVGRVDYTKTMDFWDRERWSGSFPVKWHIIKNVPNFQLHGIILQDNENKPVTNSRDTQEVNIQQGLQMLNIFKKYYARSWILDSYNIHQNASELP